MPGIYIHIPFCKQKCKYCDFNSFAGLEALYGLHVRAVMLEIASKALELDDLNTESIYIGGGTPTLLDPLHVDALLTEVYRRFTVSDDAEVTIEANPETIGKVKLAQLKQAGVNRLSIGFQSLDDGLLKLLGRKHSAAQAVRAFNNAREAGFENINIDLIFGIPGQSLANWAITLEQVVALEPDHLSCYGLMVEPQTALEREIASGKLSKPDEDLQADMFTYTIESLSESGYEHYEISNYAKPGHRSRHNLVYWNNGDYIGFGAGAHSKIGNKRFRNVSGPKEYINSVIAGTNNAFEVVDLTKDDMISETIFLGLRKIEGLDLSSFEARFGCSLQDIYGDQIAELIKDGLLERNNGSLRLTHKGILLGNEVFSRFV
ncbi:MAG: radical SAM family heme chaperone HemW [Firmicutes bacterium]|nr:radical SAM family heme chaperone HemW [Bacillota bacterium]